MGRITIINHSLNKKRYDKYYGNDYQTIKQGGAVSKITIPSSSEDGDNTVGMRGLAYLFSSNQGRVVIKYNGNVVADSLWVKNDINKSKILGSFSLPINVYDDRQESFEDSSLTESISIDNDDFQIGEDSIGSGVLFFEKVDEIADIEILIYQVESPDFKIYLFEFPNSDSPVIHSNGVIRYTNSLGYYSNPLEGDSFFTVPNLFTKYSSADEVDVDDDDFIILNAWGVPNLSEEPYLNTDALGLYLNPILSSELRLNGVIVDKYSTVTYKQLEDGELIYYPNGINNTGKNVGNFDLFIDYTIVKNINNSVGVSVEFLGKLYDGNRRAKLQIKDLVNDMPIIEEGTLVFAGNVSTIPTTGEDIITMLGNTAIPVIDTFTFTTGTVNRRFVIAIPSNKTLDSVINMGTGELLNYILYPSITVINNAGVLESYKVYIKENAVSFSNNYTIKVELI